jgi:type IV pilus assembly protein PilC
MKTYEFTALDSTGKSHVGALQVENGEAALQRVKDMRLFPTKIVEKTRDARPPAAPPAKPGGRVPAKRLCAFTRQLATLIEAGLPILRSLQILRQQEEDPGFKRVLGSVIACVEGGDTLSEALSFHPRAFNRLFINMVKAGEASGTMDVALTRLAEFMEKSERIKGKIVAGLFYPAAVLVVAGAVLALLLTVVLPKFRMVFDGMMNGKPMPEFTMAVLRLSDFAKAHFFGIALGLGAAAILFRCLIETRPGRRAYDKARLVLPVVGPVARKVVIARMSRTLGTLIQNGVPILQALAIAKETAGNLIVGNAIGAVQESVKSGETIAMPLAVSGLFPSLVVNMVDVGEKSGNLPEMLLKVADRYDEESDNAVAAMTSLMEPIMIVFLAIVVGSIVIAMFLPLLAMMEFDPNANGRNE